MSKHRKATPVKKVDGKHRKFVVGDAVLWFPQIPSGRNFVMKIAGVDSVFRGVYIGVSADSKSLTDYNTHYMRHEDLVLITWDV